VATEAWWNCTLGRSARGVRLATTRGWSGDDACSRPEQGVTKRTSRPEPQPNVFTGLQLIPGKDVEIFAKHALGFAVGHGLLYKVLPLIPETCGRAVAEVGLVPQRRG